MKILLTGGSGFIGRNIRESNLASKYEIIAPTHAQLDLADDASVDAFFHNNSFDAILHGAGKPGHRNALDPSNIFYTDIRMFLNLLKYRNQLGRIIVLGSGAIYDQRWPIVKVKEEDYVLKVPVDEHALYRRVSAEMMEQIDNVVELRIFGIFGKYEDYAIRFISNAICKTLFDLPITIKQNRTFDYLWAGDLAPVLDYFLQNPAEHKVYNLSSGRPVELLELAKQVKAISGKNLPIHIAEPGLGPEYTGDNSRLKKEISGLVFTPIKQAIQELYAWYEKNIGLLDREDLLKDK